VTIASGRLRNRIAPWLIAASPLLDLLGATVLLLALVFSRLFSNGFAYFSADHSELYFPWWVFINRTVRSGTFPVLNRFWFSGSLPFAAIETGVFYPPTMFFQLLFDARQTSTTRITSSSRRSCCITCWRASPSTLMTRGLRLRRLSGALLARWCSAAGGSFIGRFVHPLLLVNLAWVPLAYLFYLLFLRHGRVIYALGAAVVLALIVAAGHPRWSIAVPGLRLHRARRRPDRAREPDADPGLLGLHHDRGRPAGRAEGVPRRRARQQHRPAGCGESSENLFNSLHPLYYLTLLAPYLYGRHGVAYWGSQYHWGNWENFLYVGLLPILCLPFCAFWKNRRLLTIFGSGLALSVLISLGRYSALSTLLNRSLPFSSSLGYLSKITVLFHFFLVVS
jgi:hypothetical protein